MLLARLHAIMNTNIQDLIAFIDFKLLLSYRCYSPASVKITVGFVHCDDVFPQLIHL